MTMGVQTANFYVLGISIYVTNATFITGCILALMNGVLEMEGFQETYRFLYNATGDTNETCSSGNGAGSDGLIGLIVAMTPVGAAVGSVVAAWLSDHLSRKYALVISGLVVLVGAVFVAASFHLWAVFIGRFLLGISAGFQYMVAPVYVSEVSPKEHRGFLTSMIGNSLNFGFLITAGLNIGFAKFLLGWRVGFAILAALGVSYSIGMLFMPHTPRWLVKRGRSKEAMLVLSRINRKSIREEGVIDTCLELEELKAKISSDNEQTYYLLLKELFKYKYRFFITVILYLMEAVGVFGYYYSSTFFCQIGISPFYGSLMTGVVFVIGGIFLTGVIDKFGRKPMLAVCTFLHLILGIALAIMIQLGFDDTVADYAITTLLCLYTLVFAASWVTVPWIIGSEIFPINVRGFFVGISTGLYWSMATINQLLIPLIVGSPVQLHGFFYIITGFNLLGFFFVLVALPETKGVGLEAMDKLFSPRALLKNFTQCVRCNWTANMHLTYNLQEHQQQDKAVQELDTYDEIKYKDS